MEDENEENNNNNDKLLCRLEWGKKNERLVFPLTDNVFFSLSFFELAHRMRLHRTYRKLYDLAIITTKNTNTHMEMKKKNTQTWRWNEWRKY